MVVFFLAEEERKNFLSVIFFSYTSGRKIKTGLVSQTPVPWVISETGGQNRCLEHVKTHGLCCSDN